MLLAKRGYRVVLFSLEMLAVPLANLSPDVLYAAFTVLWWAHIAIVAAFLGYLPFSKHLHIATAFFNVYFRKLAPRGELVLAGFYKDPLTFAFPTACWTSSSNCANCRPASSRRW